MNRGVIILALLLVALTIMVIASVVSAKPSQYGTMVYSETADRIRIEDGNKHSVVHSTTIDPTTGLGQDNKWCAL